MITHTFGSLESKFGITVPLKLGLEMIPSSGSLMSKVGTLWAGPQDWDGFNRNLTLSMIDISLGPFKILVMAIVEIKIMGTKDRIHPIPLDHIG